MKSSQILTGKLPEKSKEPIVNNFEAILAAQRKEREERKARIAKQK